MNKVELLGRLTRNPEMKNVGGSGDTPMARYTLAVNRRYSHTMMRETLYKLLCDNENKEEPNIEE